jgi:hypothetical protein
MDDGAKAIRCSGRAPRQQGGRKICSARLTPTRRPLSAFQIGYSMVATGTAWTAAASGGTIRTYATRAIIADAELAVAATACRAMAFQEGERANKMGKPDHTRSSQERCEAICRPGGKTRSSQESRDRQ